LHEAGRHRRSLLCRKISFQNLVGTIDEQKSGNRIVFGIGRARRQPMKKLHSDWQHEREVPSDAIMRATERPKKISIVFEDDLNARGAEILIKHRRASAKISMPESRNHNKLDCLSTVRTTS
jgi:hypothetical protein